MIRIFTLFHSRIMVRIHDILEYIDTYYEKPEINDVLLYLYVLNKWLNFQMSNANKIGTLLLISFMFFYPSLINISKNIINNSWKNSNYLFIYPFMKNQLLLMNLRRQQLQFVTLMYLFPAGNMVQFRENIPTC